MTVQQHTMRDKGTMAASGRTLSVRRPASRHGMQTKTAQPAPTARWDDSKTTSHVTHLTIFDNESCHKQPLLGWALYSHCTEFAHDSVGVCGS